MRKLVILIVFCFVSCKKQTSYKVSESKIVPVKEIVDEFQIDETKSEEMFRIKLDESNTDLKYIGSFDYNRDTIYMVANNNLLKLNTNTSSIQSSSTSSLFYKTDKFENFDYLFDFKRLGYNKYMFTNFNSVVIYNQEIKSITNIYNQKNIIYSYLDSYNSLVCDYEGVKLLNEGLEVIDSMEFQFTNDFFIKSDSGFIYLDSFSGKLTSFYISQGKIKIEELKSINQIKGIPNLDNFYISLITKDTIVGFIYNDRNCIYFIDRATYKVYKKIYTSNELLISDKVIQREEGQPNINIIFKDGYYYIIALNTAQELLLFRTK